MDRIVYLNGDFLPLDQAKISVMDRGFLFADGVYEVIPVYNGRPFRADEHLKRLQRSLDGIRLDYHVDKQEWMAIVNGLIGKNNARDGDQCIYLQITRGAYEQRAHTFPDVAKPTCFAQCTPISPLPAGVLEKGMSAITSKDIRWQQCHIKSISLLPNILLTQDAKEQGATEAILIENGMMVEGASSNVFIVKDGAVTTPPLSDQILSGVTRNVVLELAHENHISCKEADVSENALCGADEIWVTSSTRMIYPIVQLDGKPVGDGSVGPVWKKMMALYERYK